MAEISIADAIAIAVERLALRDPVAATAWRTFREDRPGESYVLVVLGDPHRAQGVAAIDAVTGEVMEWAELPGTGPHLTMSSDDAIRRAGSADSPAVLVWRPGRASPSMLAPVWRVGSDGDARYVDQQGAVWDTLEPGPTGG